MGSPKSSTLCGFGCSRLNDEGNKLGSTTDLVACLHWVQRVFDGESRQKARKCSRECSDCHRLATERFGFLAKLRIQNHKWYIGHDKNGIWFFALCLRFHTSYDMLRREVRENYPHRTINPCTSRPPDIHDGRWIGVK